MATLDAHVRTPIGTEFDAVSREFHSETKKIIFAVLTAAVIGIGATLFGAWKITEQNRMRLDAAYERMDRMDDANEKRIAALEKRMEQADDRERKTADRLSELGTDVRWIRRELEGRNK